MYATYADYQARGGVQPQGVIAPLLQRASDDCDALTFGRVAHLGFDNLTEFQQAQIKAFCCEQADFLEANADAVESAMEAYAINGVSMKFGNAALYSVRSGLPVSNRAWALLEATGLTARCAAPWESDRALA